MTTNAIAATVNVDGNGAHSARWWTPLGTEINTYGDDLLTDPRELFGRTVNPALRTLEELELVRCLACLGEPGSGKSTDLRRAYERLAANARVWVDCRDISSENWFRDVLANDVVIRACQAGDPGITTLFIDSLDEGVLSSDRLAAAIAAELPRLPLDRVRIRVACRTAEWPALLDERLRQLFPVGFEVRELAPLTRGQVREAARALGADADAFLQAAYEAGASAMLGTPVTLDLLLRLYRANDALPARRAGVYDQGTRLLCEETNPSRRQKLRGRLASAVERRAIASRIAATTILCGHAAVWREVDRGDVPESDIAQSELIGGTEPLSESSTSSDVVTVTAPAIEDVLAGTALFTSAGSHRVTWMHRTYADFLAARWLAANALDVEQIDTICFARVGDTMRVPPQLRETVAWLAGMRADVADRLMTREPTLVVLSDVAVGSSDRRRVIAALLDAAERHELPDYSARMRTTLGELGHADLADQLRPELERSAHPERQEFALRVIGATRTASLASAVAGLAAAATVPIHVRTVATYTLGDLAEDDGEASLHLCELALTPVTEDPEQRILGAALDGLWPQWLDAGELVELLAPVHRDAHFGAYQAFLLHLERALPQAAAVEFVRQSAANGIPHGLERLAVVAMRQAWPVVRSDDDVTAFSATMISALRHEWNFLERERGADLAAVLSADHTRRRELLLELLRGGADQGIARSAILFHSNGLAGPADVAWAIDLLVAQPLGSRTTAAAEGLRDLIRRFRDPADPVMANALIEGVSASAALAEEFGPLAIALDSQAATRARELEATMRRFDAAPQTEAPPAEEPSIDLAPLLQRVDSGDIDAWMQIDASLGDPPRGDPESLFRDDTRISAQWASTSPTERERIVAAAARFLASGDPQTSAWLGTGSYPFRVTSAVRAMRLVHDEAPGEFARMSDAVLERWCPALLQFHSHVEEGLAAQKQLIATLTTRIPDAVVRDLRRRLQSEDVGRGSLLTLDKLPTPWPDIIATDMIAFADSTSLSPRSQARLLRAVMENASPREAQAATTVVTRLAAAVDSPDQEMRARADAAASLLLLAPGPEWNSNFDRLATSPAVFKRVALLSATRETRRAGLLSELSEAQLGRLFDALALSFPFEEDSQVTQLVAHSVEPSEEARHWRNGILSILQARGTVPGIIELERIASEHTTLPWLGVYAAEARLEVARRMWNPVSYADLRFLAGNGRRRVVRNADELLEAVVESLARFQQELSGDTPLAETLWDERAEERFRPKPEAALANALKRHLQAELGQRGVIANREVEVRAPGLGGGEGSRTDVHVDAAVQDAGGGMRRVTVVIEVKGAWHAATKTALATQLVAKYLAPAGTATHGLFVVGWYDSAHWDAADWRKKPALKHGTKDLLASELQQQAAVASAGSHRVQAIIIDCSLSLEQISPKDAEPARARPKRSLGAPGRRPSRR